MNREATSENLSEKIYSCGFVVKGLTFVRLDGRVVECVFCLEARLIKENACIENEFV